ncbi:hypothetical protein Dpoa2040_001170 [Dickeya sp. CFBP 2040]|nr:hypothetical protein [Dickeya sp. CFBP 2040]
MKVFITNEKKAELECLHDASCDEWVCERIKVVLLASEGWSLSMIAQALHLNETMVNYHINEFANKHKLKPENSRDILSNGGKFISWCIKVGCFSVEAYGIPLTALLCMDLLKRIPGAVITAILDKEYFNESARKLLSNGRHIPVAKDVNDTEIRRRILALLAHQSIEKNAMFLHASVIARNQQAIVLLGDYGAGKTTVALQMIQCGWQQVAGDICLIGAEGDVIAGSRAVLSRQPLYKEMQPTRLPLPEGEVRWEVDACHGGPYEGIKIRGVVVVDVHEAVARYQDMPLAKLSQLVYQAATRVLCRKNSSWGEQFLTMETRQTLERIATKLSSEIISVELKGNSDFIVESINSKLFTS